jgi:hypothetical protein
MQQQNGPRLACLGGEPAPAELAHDLTRLLELPSPAKAALWRVLAPSLEEHIDEQTEKLLTAYCKDFGIGDDALARPLKAARHLFREAAKRAISRDAFEHDLTTLLGQERARGVSPLLMLHYDEALRAIRIDIVRAALLDHGSLLLGFDWRVDTIATSPRGKKLGTSVALLTFKYKSGERTERLTVQALPDVLVEMRAALDEMLGKGG